MEVLMSRSKNRLSRQLIGILIFVITIGLVFYIHDVARSHAEDQPKIIASVQKPAISTEIATPAHETPPAQQPMVSSAPRSEVSIGPAPTLKPAASLSGTSPNTKP